MLDRLLRVFTLNLNNQRPDPRGDMLVRNALIELQPDLVSFQEVDWNGEAAHQGEAIFAGLDYQVVHQFDLQRPDRPYGTLIASRWPIQRSDLVKLPSTERGKDFPRAIQVAEIEAPEPIGALLLVNPKPHYEPHMELEREMQAVALADYVERNAAPDGFPPIVAGDLDATPEASSIRFLTGLQSLHGRSTHFVDAWKAAGNEGPGYTWACENDLVRQVADRIVREKEHRRRLDYILLGGPLLYKGYARVEECRVVLDQPRDGVWASGHYGVFAEIALGSQ